MKNIEKIDYDAPKPLKEGEHWVDRYKPEYAEQAERLKAVGFTNKDLAYNFGISLYGLKTWRDKFPDFKAACNRGKHFIIKKIAAKGLMEAVGYNYETSKTRIIKDKDGNVQKIEETHFKNHQAANNNLLIFLLCNLAHQLGLAPEENWTSKQKMEIEQKNMNVEITGKVAADQIERLAGALLKEEETRKQINSTVVETE